MDLRGQFSFSSLFNAEKDAHGPCTVLLQGYTSQCMYLSGAMSFFNGAYGRGTCKSYFYVGSYTGAVRAPYLETRRTAPLKKLFAPERYAYCVLHVLDGCCGYVATTVIAPPSVQSTTYNRYTHTKQTGDRDQSCASINPLIILSILVISLQFQSPFFISFKAFLLSKL